MWQMSYPLEYGASLGSYFCVKNLTSAQKYCLNKPILPFFEEAHIVKRAKQYRPNDAEIFEMYEFFVFKNLENKI